MRREHLSGVSVIIPTYNRAHDLKRCLESLLAQTLKPLEVIIVDDSSNDDTLNLVAQMRGSFHRRGIPLKYIKTRSKFKSLTRARNIGSKLAKGDILLFLDDDVVLSSNYIAEIHRSFEKCPQAMAAIGFITNIHMSTLNNLLNRFFWLFHTSQNKAKLLVSLDSVYPTADSSVEYLKCDLLTGNNMAIRKKVFKEGLKFDEKLLRYSWREDHDFALSLKERYGANPVCLAMNARLLHLRSSAGRIPSEKFILIREAYQLYVFYKHGLDKKALNNFIYWWSRFGFLIMLVIGGIKGNIRNRFKEAALTLKALRYVISERNKIKRRDLGEINKVFTG
ncbi:glycosyltransferase family 2 protein [Pyrococcus sp. ST04]|uniref:glycosyltransferase family 2 protein n=1 Tax=Pyrococcus sp. ST04 TaxID=1183377 RepID=UPI0002605A9A|nr:glycosyltransferase family 2 protein [Pyrococcus sp. ST04]AFK22091.1 putative glycosyl transferase family 2 protein [Pyrococcus sp. ST04]